MKILKGSLVSILILGIMFTGLIGCIDNSTEGDSDEAPQLPPDSSMSMDFSAFGHGKMAPSATLAQKNFNAAAGRVIILDVAVILVLAPPVALFKSAQTTVPVLQPDGSWSWKYKVKFLGQEYDAHLNGRLEGFKTVWSMKVTNLTRLIPLDDFEWYYGEAALNNQSGEWHFFDPATPDEENEVAVIDWKVESNTKAKIEYSNTNERGVNFGDTLSYGIDGTTASIVFYDESDDLESDINWDIFTIEGNLMVPDYNGGERAFWDENKEDYIP